MAEGGGLLNRYTAFKAVSRVRIPLSPPVLMIHFGLPQGEPRGWMVSYTVSIFVDNSLSRNYPLPSDEVVAVVS